MRSLAKTLIAGTLLATGPFCGAATSQDITGQVFNDQRQSDDIFAGQVLDVVEPDGGVQVGAGAQGNAFGAGADGLSLQVQSRQRLNGNVTADTEAYVTGSTPFASSNAAAVGNSNSEVTFGGNLNSRTRQDVSAGRTVSAESTVQQDGGSTGYAVGAATAVANSSGQGVTGGWIQSDVRQTSGATVRAESEGAVRHVTDTAAFTSTAVGNNHSSAVAYGSGSLRGRQTQNGESVLAGTYVTSANAAVATGASTAAGNTMVHTNSYGPMEVDARQSNDSYVRSQTYVAGHQFGLLGASASGVGNAFVAGSEGSDASISINQRNRGPVDVVADVQGGEGYDTFSNASAVGNSASGYVCSECPGPFTADNRQVNEGAVTATSNTSVTGWARTATGTSNAVGNTATYYVTRPGG